MPYEIQVDPASRVAVLVGHGETDPDEGHATLVALAAHPDFEPGFGLVCDLRDMDYWPTSEAMMKGFENVVRFKPILRGRIAFVVGDAMAIPSEISAALYSTEGLEAQVFTEPAAAVGWVQEPRASGPAA